MGCGPSCTDRGLSQLLLHTQTQIHTPCPPCRPPQEEIPASEAYEHSEMLLYKAQVGGGVHLLPAARGLHGFAAGACTGPGRRAPSTSNTRPPAPSLPQVLREGGQPAAALGLLTGQRERIKDRLGAAMEEAGLALDMGRAEEAAAHYRRVCVRPLAAAAVGRARSAGAAC